MPELIWKDVRKYGACDNGYGQFTFLLRVKRERDQRGTDSNVYSAAPPTSAGRSGLGSGWSGWGIAGAPGPRQSASARTEGIELVNIHPCLQCCAVTILI